MTNDNLFFIPSLVHVEPDYSKQNKAGSPSKQIKFPILYSWFSYKKLSKNYARLVISQWIRMGLIERIKFHGIKLKNNEKEKAFINTKCNNNY